MRAQSLYKPDVVEGGRAQVAHDPADIRDCGLRLGARPFDQLSDVLRMTVSCGFQRERDSRERRAEAVMKLPANASAFLLACSDDALARVLKLGRQPKRIESRCDLLDQELDKVKVCRRVAFSRSTGADEQAAE